MLTHPLPHGLTYVELMRLTSFILLCVLGSAPTHRCNAQVVGEHWFRFHYDNDFFNATDRYYTQGINLELAARFVDRSPVRHMLLGLGAGASKQQVLFARQDCFTPSSIRRDTILRTDRPFAAAMYVGQRSISTDTERKQRLTSSISIGAIGPCASCAEEQMGIHKALSNIAPVGWQHQVASDAILNYSVLLEQRMLKARFAEISAGVGAETGTYRTNANVRARLEIGSFNSTFDASPLHDRSLQVSAFIFGETRAIGYDATYQGGVFNRDSPHTLPASSIERIVLRVEGGLRIRYHALSLLYSKTFITREFTDGLDHGWGSVVITTIF